MSGRLLKCYGWCNKKHKRDNLVKVGSRNFCIPCAELKEKEQNDRKVLYKTIQTVFKIPYPSGMMLRQIKQFSEDRNYTLEGMTKTICYFVKVQKKQPFKNAGLSFLPYYYDTAISYYDELEERRKRSAEINNNKKILKISANKWKQQSNLKDKKIVDLGGILNDS